MEHLFDAFGKNNTYQPPSNTGITRASNECYAVSGFLRREMDSLDTALDGGNKEQFISCSTRERVLDRRRRRCSEPSRRRSTSR